MVITLVAVVCSFFTSSPLLLGVVMSEALLVLLFLSGMLVVIDAVRLPNESPLDGMIGATLSMTSAGIGVYLIYLVAVR